MCHACALGACGGVPCTNNRTCLAVYTPGAVCVCPVTNPFCNAPFSDGVVVGTSTVELASGNQQTRLCLDSGDLTVGCVLSVNVCVNTSSTNSAAPISSQLWQLYSDGTLRPRLATSLCLTFQKSGLWDGVPLLLGNCAPTIGDAQMFNVLSTLTPSSIAPKAMPTLTLGAANGTLSAGQQVVGRTTGTSATWFTTGFVVDVRTPTPTPDRMTGYCSASMRSLERSYVSSMASTTMRILVSQGNDRNRRLLQCIECDQSR